MSQFFSEVLNFSIKNEINEYKRNKFLKIKVSLLQSMLSQDRSWKQQKINVRYPSRFFINYSYQYFSVGFSPALFYFDSNLYDFSWANVLKIMELVISRENQRTYLEYVTLLQLISNREKGFVVKDFTRIITMQYAEQFNLQQSIIQYGDGFTLGNNYVKFSTILGVELGYYNLLQFKNGFLASYFLSNQLIFRIKQYFKISVSLKNFFKSNEYKRFSSSIKLHLFQYQNISISTHFISHDFIKYKTYMRVNYVF